ncbi:uncharacterized protein BDV17DRAFT_104218 [Aspergillus undulatus]|uniref:uncharacterized protein n=1 Tax=Aspergillus undulatus TaxID=1810928 RepID=UPI003CCCF5AE
MAKMSLIASNVYKQMAVPGQFPRDSTSMLSEYLNHWHHTLPTELRLFVLSRMEEAEITKLHERTLYLMHVPFMKTYLLVYCCVIKSQRRAFRDADGQGCLETLFEDMLESVHAEYTHYAIQLSRSISILCARGCLMTRCWVAMGIYRLPQFSC